MLRHDCDTRALPWRLSSPFVTRSKNSIFGKIHIWRLQSGSPNGRCSKDGCVNSVFARSRSERSNFFHGNISNCSVFPVAQRMSQQVPDKLWATGNYTTNKRGTQEKIQILPTENQSIPREQPDVSPCTMVVKSLVSTQPTTHTCANHGWHWPDV